MRRYALSRLAPGDYVCPSNDGETLWRFVRYEDGRVHGLVDVSFERRDFWMVQRAPVAAARRAIDRDEEPEWETYDTMLPTRRAAVVSVFGSR